jgi:hypothetical protein
MTSLIFKLLNFLIIEVIKMKIFLFFKDFFLNMKIGQKKCPKMKTQKKSWKKKILLTIKKIMVSSVS